MTNAEPSFPAGVGDGVSIVASFSIPGIVEGGTVTKRHAFGNSCARTAVLGLAEGVEAVKPPPGSYVYSGVHDHGPMIPPREGGPFADLVGCAVAAKEASDSYLTGVIEAEQKNCKEESAKANAKARIDKEKERKKGEKRKAEEE
eukprot:CAMPEP_0197441294 /NCGR_PEP_ID=MMETSP1175-20131217/7600_1 /TAXON_ID=1003142 /ORGANISM="Triceratium dubium, Strain CCMP147" /LENGTH=144 /DNA_ID=CAMNT_0042971549 /DNA_START=17 /DNA_END=451 /DNA_ORIENTATION=-